VSVRCRKRLGDRLAPDETETTAVSTAGRITPKCLGLYLENCMRYPLEVFEAVRAAWPDDKPLGIRISATDWIDGGWTAEESMVFAGELKALRSDFIDVSSGALDPRQKIPLGPGYQVPFSAKIRTQAEIAPWTVGMITKARQAEEIIAGGKADIVALARGMMFDPR
jgi:2,4-dienoyl-CoA reductase-like NADH-dependent reductase (Old Yellow Enzyme family)